MEQGNFNDLIPEDYLERMPRCPTCHRSKAPLGRDVAAAMAGAYCHWDECDDYRNDPKPSSFWPGEFGHFDLDLHLAGPAMLAALKYVRESYGPPMNDPPKDEWDDALCRVEAAIAKAQKQKDVPPILL